MERRTFLEKTVLSGLALSAYPYIESLGITIDPAKKIEKRKLGKTGERLSIIGFGGILVMNEQAPTAADLVAKAIDLGINYFDVAPSYGNAEDMLGPAFAPYRKKNFLACKTQKRTKDEAEKEMAESFKKLKTDYFDLYQLHALSSVEEVEKVFASGGAMEAIVKAKKDGKIKYIGFSAHSQEAALLAMEKFDFDTILLPINFVCWHQGDFGPKAIEKAREKGMGILALKAMAHTKAHEGDVKPEKVWYIPIDDMHIAELSLRFTLSQGVTAAIPPGNAAYWWKAIEIAQNLKPLSNAELQEIVQLSTKVEPLFSAK